MDLHAWITQQVEKAATDRPPHDVDCDSLPKARSCCGAAECYCGHDDTFPCDCGVPAAVLRRCEADRRILARHTLDPARADSWMFATACMGCGTDGDFQEPVTENLNDCPELLDLGYAHGLTDEILAGLDRPQPPERKVRIHNKHSLADVLGIATPPITTSDVPEALRGPRWKP